MLLVKRPFGLYIQIQIYVYHIYIHLWNISQFVSYCILAGQYVETSVRVCHECMYRELDNTYNYPHASFVSSLLDGCIANYSIRSDQIRSVVQSCPTLCNPVYRSTPGLPVHHQLSEFIETHIHLVSDAIQPSHALSSLSPLAPNPSQHQSLFQ